MSSVQAILERLAVQKQQPRQKQHPDADKGCSSAHQPPAQGRPARPVRQLHMPPHMFMLRWAGRLGCLSTYETPYSSISFLSELGPCLS